MARPRSKYGSIGGYQSGLWLVAKGGQGIIVNRQNIPKGSGFSYYWLGSQEQQILSRLPSAVNKLGVNSDVLDPRTDLTGIVGKAMKTGKAGLPTPATGGGVLGWIRRALGAANSSGVVVTGPLGGATSADAAAAAEGGATAAGGITGAAAGGAILGTAGIVGSTTDFLNYIAWIFHPLNILRAVEFLMGGLLMGMSLWKMLGSPSNSGLGHVARELAAATPAGAASRRRTGRRMGRREGQREAARMGARREATRSERTASANERERINRGARKNAGSDRLRVVS